MWWNSGIGYCLFPLVIVNFYLHRLQGIVGESEAHDDSFFLHKSKVHISQMNKIYLVKI